MLAKPDKRTTAGDKLNKGSSDGFFAIRISDFYDSLSQKTKAEPVRTDSSGWAPDCHNNRDTAAPFQKYKLIKSLLILKPQQ